MVLWCKPECWRYVCEEVDADVGIFVDVDDVGRWMSEFELESNVSSLFGAV